MGSLDVDEIHKEMLDEFNRSPIPRDFIKSVCFARWQFEYLLQVASEIIEAQGLTDDSPADIVGALIKLMELV